MALIFHSIHQLFTLTKREPIHLQTDLYLYTQEMGVSCSDDHANAQNRFIPLDPVELYHFGSVDRYYDQTTNREVIKPTYEFVVEADAAEQFVNHLRMNNNKCPSLVSIVKIEVEAGSYCDRGSRYHVYFEYLPLTLNKILK